MNSGDTIVAISSAVGAAARMIVRVSGPRAFPVASSILTAPVRGDHASSPHWFTVPSIAYCFVGPRSSTGEDIVELHIPGNPLLARDALARLIAAGARQAEAGEFSARAYFNGRIDLTQAEGISLAVSAANEGELRAARQLLAGEPRAMCQASLEQLASTLALVEVWIDFTEEDVIFITPAQIAEQLQKLDDDLHTLLSQATRFDRLTHEPTFALVGWPNAGKSTLLNTLAGQQRAVVSHVAGTTRDAISAEVVLQCGLVKLIDAAGIEPEDLDQRFSPQAHINSQMRKIAEKAAATADFVILVHAADDSRAPPELGRAFDCVALTKVDCSDAVAEGGAGCELRSPGRGDDASPQHAFFPADTLIRVSAHTGEGIETLKQSLDALAFGRPGGASVPLNERHLTAIAAARRGLSEARAAAAAPAEIVALHLRQALDALGTITGQITPDDVLGRVFATFCIGK